MEINVSDGLTLFNLDVASSLIEKFAKRLNDELEEYVIEGLKRKGFIFYKRKKLEKFIEEHCTRFNRTDVKQETFFVDGEPFLVHDYNIPDLEFLSNSDGMSVSTNFGKYTYL